MNAPELRNEANDMRERAPLGYPPPVRDVVLAIDSGEVGRHVLQRVATLPFADGARATVLTVARLGTLGVSMPAYARAEQAAWAHAAAMSEYARVLFERRGGRGRVRVSPGAAVGTPALEIIRSADAARADLVVIGRRRDRGLLDTIVGPTTERLIRKSPTPVLVVSGPATARYARPLLAVDFCDRSKRMVEAALRVVPAGNGVVVLVHVVPPEAAEPEETLRLRLIRFFEPLARGIDWRLEVRRGERRRELLEACHDAGADLLGLGTRQHPLARRLFEGSTAAALARSAPCDALIVPPSRRLEVPS